MKTLAFSQMKSYIYVPKKKMDFLLHYTLIVDAVYKMKNKIRNATFESLCIISLYIRINKMKVDTIAWCKWLKITLTALNVIIT